MNKQQIINEIREKVKGIDICMMVTATPDGKLEGRPMSTQEISDDGVLWFMTKNSSDKITHVANNNSISLQYDAGDKVTYVSLYGAAQVVEDKEKIKELWNPFYKAWFSDVDDPEITLLKVSVMSGEYWDNKASKLGSYWDMAKAIVTGTNQEADEGQGSGENKEFDL